MDILDSKAARTRRRILDVSARVFAEQGYGGASLRRIAADAGLQVGSLYFHFPTKDELVAATLVDGVDSARAALQKAIDSVPDDAPALDRLRAAIRGHLEALHASDDRAAAVVRMVETLPPHLRSAHVVHERRFARVWQEVLERGRHAGVVRTDVDPRTLRDLVVGALNSTSTNNPAAKKDLGAVTEAVLTLLQPTVHPPGSPIRR